MSAETGLLHRLARLYGVQTAYYGADHTRHSAPVESLLAVLRALGAPVSSLRDIPEALRLFQAEKRTRPLEPVTVAWNGDLGAIAFTLPKAQIEKTRTGCLILEDGNRIPLRWNHRDTVIIESSDFDGTARLKAGLHLRKKLPFGYHKFVLETPDGPASTFIISAPARSFLPEEYQSRWGVFLPLYSLHSSRSWGAGDFSDLAMLTDWVGKMGGQAVASLPLLPAFLDRPLEFSPYLPVSRLFWNEFYLDVTGIPEFINCPQARTLFASSGFQQTLSKLRTSTLVDYRGVMALKRRVLSEMCRYLFAIDSPRFRALKQWVGENPEIQSYARFRAVTEGQGKGWQRWPSSLRDGNIESGDCNQEVFRYHLYVQWLAEQQLNSVAEKAEKEKVSLYLDLPLGTHPQGYDTWRYRDLFVKNTSVGAPPDSVFVNGQSWTFPPLHPEQIRESGYAYFIAYLRHHLRLAKMLRIDHVMGFHRLYFIPRGLDSSQGVYVRYRPGEMYAILCLESHRYKSVIVGEDLGIVPREVRAAMSEHGLQRLYVTYYELAENSPRVLPAPGPASVASLNTHDMPPFAAFWSGLDINDRQRVGIINAATSHKELARRKLIRKRLIAFLRKKQVLAGTGETASVLQACLCYLALSPARFLLVNLEDLWLETRTQNIPGTSREHPNWRVRSRYNYEDFCKMPAVVAILEEIERWRKGRKQKP